MKRYLIKQLLLAGIAIASVPAFALAQKEKNKEKKETETIIITRKGDIDVKTVIEIKGDKITINGKEVKEGDKENNVSVMRHRFNGNGPVIATAPGAWNFNMNENQFDLFDEDENRAMLGVVTEENDKGAEVQLVNKGSAAEKAGLKKGDIITRIGDKKIESTDDVTEEIKSRKPGDKVNITFLRDGKEQKINAELGKWKGIRMNTVEMPRMRHYYESVPQALDRIPFEGGNGFTIFTGRPKLGLSIQDTDDGKGVKVLEVEEESNAAKAGIKEGDLILSIDDKEVRGTEDVTRTIRENREKYTFNFKIDREGKTQNIEVKMPRKLKTADL